jgi:hypothetical protein
MFHLSKETSSGSTGKSERNVYYNYPVKKRLSFVMLFCHLCSSSTDKESVTLFLSGPFRSGQNRDFWRIQEISRLPRLQGIVVFLPE